MWALVLFCPKRGNKENHRVLLQLLSVDLSIIIALLRLAVVRALCHLHPYLYRQPFLLRTDHASMNWLFCFHVPEGPLGRGWRLSKDTPLRLVTGLTYYMVVPMLCPGM